MARTPDKRDQSLIPTPAEIEIFYDRTRGPIRALYAYRLRTGADIAAFYHGLTLLDPVRRPTSKD